MDGWIGGWVGGWVRDRCMRRRTATPSRAHARGTRKQRERERGRVCVCVCERAIASERETDVQAGRWAGRSLGLRRVSSDVFPSASHTHSLRDAHAQTEGHRKTEGPSDENCTDWAPCGPLEAAETSLQSQGRAHATRAPMSAHAHASAHARTHASARAHGPVQR